MLENAHTQRTSKVQQDNISETAKSAEDLLASEQARKLKVLADKVENFIEGEGDIEGARFEE